MKEKLKIKNYGMKHTPVPEPNETERLLSEILKALLKIEANTRRVTEL